MSKKVEFLYLSQEDVIDCGALDMGETLKCVEKATLMLYQKDAIEADMAHLLWGKLNGKRIGIHAAYLGKDLEITGGKVIPSNPENPFKRGMPRASAVTILCDPETMYPISIMEGVIISHMRTGAMTGVGAKYLAKKGPAVVGIIGAGPIARTTLMALNAAIDQIQKVKLFDLSDQRARLFKEELGKELGVDIQIVKSAEEAVREADIFAPATNVGPGESYIEYRWLKQGCFFSDPSMYDEKDEVILKADKVVINNYQTLENPHDRLAPLIADKRFSKERAIDFGSIIAGKAKGRENDKEIIVFCPRGMCIFDICNAYRIYKTAKARGVGQLLPLWSKPLWI